MVPRGPHISTLRPALNICVRSQRFLHAPRPPPSASGLQPHRQARFVSDGCTGGQPHVLDSCITQALLRASLEGLENRRRGALDDGPQSLAGWKAGACLGLRLGPGRVFWTRLRICSQFCSLLSSPCCIVIEDLEEKTLSLLTNRGSLPTAGPQTRLVADCLKWGH